MSTSNALEESRKELEQRLCDWLMTNPYKSTLIGKQVTMTDKPQEMMPLAKWLARAIEDFDAWLKTQV